VCAHTVPGGAGGGDGGEGRGRVRGTGSSSGGFFARRPPTECFFFYAAADAYPTCENPIVVCCAPRTRFTSFAASCRTKQNNNINVIHYDDCVTTGFRPNG